MKSVVCSLLVAGAYADCYMHRPRGSNNRLNEQSANRNNGDRLFDSQNNNRGGYNVGDATDDAFDGSTTNQPGSPFPNALDEDQYALSYFEESKLKVEWTVQHGCGGNEEDDQHKLNCNMVVQFTCNTADAGDHAMRVNLKDGRNTNTPNDANSLTEVTSGSQRQSNDAAGRGRHESEGWYYECEERERNKGLFVADQKLQGDSAIYTRQNPNGNRRGLECAEERDYYPYWSPSPWMDIAYLTDDLGDCDGSANTPSLDVLHNSQNVKALGKCTYTPGGTPDEDYFKYIDQADCVENGGHWATFTHGIPAPECKQAAWSRVNHLGNARTGDGLETASYDWTVPTLAANQIGANTLVSSNTAKCVMRLRYNISTDDYDRHTTNSSYNDNPKEGVQSPVQENPTVDIGLSPMQGLRLAINTNQFGRTFQDRSHTFYVKKKPTLTDLAGGNVAVGNIVNLGVRGKRGNIVQTFPSTEYDFVPNKLELNTGDLFHIQWTGSNTHNNGNPAGDGQAGDAGEGTGGTDRHNMASMLSRAHNYPIALDKAKNDADCPQYNGKSLSELNLFSNMDCWRPTSFSKDVHGWAAMNQDDAAVYLATGSFYRGVAEANQQNEDLSVLLNNAPASLREGVLCRMTKAGEYHYMATRNNNFSNRSQKGSITVNDPSR